jgi:long-chain acyl-CoA synthetase
VETSQGTDRTTLGFWHFAARDGAKTALVEVDRREWTRAELARAANRISNLILRRGLSSGEVVAVASPNCAEMVMINLAVTQIGMYLLAVNCNRSAADAEYLLRDSGVRLLMVHQALGGTGREISALARTAGIQVIEISQQTEEGGDDDLNRLMSTVSDEPPGARSAGALLTYTSGTTGRPKGVWRALKNAPPEDIYRPVIEWAQLTLGITPEGDSVFYCGSPLYHVSPMQWLAQALDLGHKVVLTRSWHPVIALHVIEHYRVTNMLMVPSQFVMLLKLSESRRKSADVSSLRLVVHSSAPCPIHVKRAMLEWWGDIIFEIYAATEAGTTLSTPANWRRYPGTVGVVRPPHRIRVIGANGSDVPVGCVGTLYFLNMSYGDFVYRGDAAKTAANRIDDYVTVGDVGYMNEEGFVFLCDRRDDTIICHGENVYPAQVEGAILEHPSVADCGVIGIPDEVAGEAIVAVVVLVSEVADKASLTRELEQVVGRGLGRRYVPKRIEYADSLPRDPSGKLSRRMLRNTRAALQTQSASAYVTS